MPDNKMGFSFVWKIENFSMLPHQLDEYICSPKFVVDVWKNMDFCLRLYPRGNGREGFMSLYIEKEPEDRDLKLNFALVVESTKPSTDIIYSIKGHVLKDNFGFSIRYLDNIYDQRNYFLPQDTLTLRCDMEPADEPTELNMNQDLKTSFNSSRFLRCVSQTCIQVQKRSITLSIWNVKELIQRQENSHILLKTALKNSPRLKLTLHFNGIKGEHIPITILQTKLSSKHKRLFVKCKIIATGIHEEYLSSKTSSHLFKLSSSDVWSFPSFLQTNMFADKKYSQVNYALSLRCEFVFSYKDSPVRHSENNPMLFISPGPKKSELNTCFENLYGSGKFCDVELKCGGRTFPYYKNVLCARSSVFNAMFVNSMVEKETNVVEIIEFDPDTLQRMLIYMHSDVLEENLSAQDAKKLYIMADKYDLPSLKKQCSVMMAATVSVLNMCKLLVLADAHRDNFLMTAVSDFICSSTVNVFRSVQWTDFMEDNLQLSCKVMHKILARKCHF